MIEEMGSSALNESFESNNPHQLQRDSITIDLEGGSDEEKEE